MALPSGSGSFGRAALVALAALAAWWLVAPRDAMPPFPADGERPAYSTSVYAQLPIIEPVLHAPWLAGASVAGVATAVLVISAGAGLTVVTSSGLLAAVLALLALVLDRSFGAALAHQAGLAIAVGLIWLAAGGVFSEPTHPGPAPWVRSLAAVLLWALAVWWHWLALAAWPVVFAGLRRRPNRPARGVWTVASLALGAAAVVAHFSWMAAAAARTAYAGTGADLSWADAMSVAFEARPSLPIGSFAAPDLTTRPSLVATALCGAGLAFGALAAWWRRAVISTAVLIVSAGVVWPAWQAEALRFGLWLMMPLAAVGLSWAARQATGHRRAAVLFLGAVMVADTVVTGVRPLEDVRPFRDRFEEELDRQAGR
ncbi:MAG: hypothetical protein R2712_30485 [Vicinamibacterales bacterium]